MKYRYDKPRIAINYWFVSKEDIRKIYEYFSSRFKVSVDFTLKTSGGETHTYDSFKEFENDLDQVISNKELVDNISIGSSESTQEIRKHAWINIDFNNRWMNASFHIIAEDKDGSLKDWVEGVYADLLKLARNFQIEDPKIINKLKDKFSSPINEVVLIFDAFGEKKKQIIEEALIKVINTNNVRPKWWEASWVQIIFVLAALAAIIALFKNWQ